MSEAPAAPVEDVGALRARVAALLASASSTEKGYDGLLELHRELVAAAAQRRDPAEAEELAGLARELLVEGAIRPLRALERMGNALKGLEEAGPPSEVLDRVPAEAADAIDLDRVVLGRIADGRLIAEAVHCRGESEGQAALLERLRAAPALLGYPLVEAELLRRRRAEVVAAGAGTPLDRMAYGETMAWDRYLAAPILLAGRIVGFLHGDREPSRPPLGQRDAEALASFASAAAAIFERAVLRHRLRVQGQELRQIARWADARTGELSDSAIDLSLDGVGAKGAEPLGSRPQDAALRDLLTRRELEVLHHMVDGETNADIARALVVSEGTVKFHVKNILRKLNVSNRAEATARYLRMSLRKGDGPGAPGHDSGRT